MHNEKITTLAQKYLNGTATDLEIQELHQWYNQWEDDEETVTVTANTDTPENIQQRILNKLQKQILSHSRQPAGVIAMSKHRWYRVAIAIIILLIAGIYFRSSDTGKQNHAVKINNALPNDVAAPSGVKAIITLADGTRVPLGNITSGILAMQGQVNIIKNKTGEIVYEGSYMSHPGAAGARYNTLTNPRGSAVISLTLNDGSRIWLNSESSLKYPIAFIGDSRRVEITGEAYFEVAKDPQRKFIVTANGTTTEALGTHFNINAYKDEIGIKVTLMEGSVRLNNSILLKPRQQGQINGSIKVVNADVDLVMAWKNGWFEFGNADITTIMNRISRWYDLDIVYEGKPGNEKFGGRISKDLPLSTVLRSLEENSAGAKFRLEGKKLIVHL